MSNLDIKIPWPGWNAVGILGRGSYGAVYEIERDVFGEKEKAALKVISIPHSDSEIDDLFTEGYDGASITNTFREYLKNIIAEYSLMRKLNGCSNVVSCDDVVYIQHDDGFGWDVFIRMELLTPLKTALGREISDQQVIRIGSDLCKALVLCKKHAIIHRDIKPANIFVSDNGDYKLGDFGVARTMEKTSGATKIGTYEYMAPEVYQGRPYGSTADIYSLGMVLYWLLNERRTPFLPLPPEMPGSSEKELARQRRFNGEKLPDPAHGSRELKRIVLKACAYDPEDRYQSADEMLKDLDSLGRGSEREEPPEDESDATLWTGPDPEDLARKAAERMELERAAREEAESKKRERIAREEAEREEAARIEREHRSREEAMPELRNRSTPLISPPAAQSVETVPDKKKNRPLIIGIAAAVLICVILAVFIIGNHSGDRKTGFVSESGPVSAEAEYTLPAETSPVSSFADASVGDIVVFGSYEQDNNTENGTEPIEWLVLAKEDERLLLISKYALDCQPYHTPSSDAYVDGNWLYPTVVTWEICTLRSWLNTTFLSTAFNAEEQAAIPRVFINADRNPYHDTEAGESTSDRVFLLSIPEANQFFNSNIDRKCQGTVYCYAQGAYEDVNGNCFWWLRSPGEKAYYAANVRSGGGVSGNGEQVDRYFDAVRPALWVDIGNTHTIDSSAEDNTTEEPGSPFSAAEAGDIIVFGSYEQDNNPANGAEPIEWLVLAKEDNKLLLISKYALDYRQYNKKYVDVTWETCSLRQWLNDTFLNSAFSEEERSIIPDVTVSADKNPNYRTDPGVATTDKVFLLSVEEANRFFAYNRERVCAPTAFAEAHGHKISNGECVWWLRTPGQRSNRAAYVKFVGSASRSSNIVDEGGSMVNSPNVAVRPAIWIDLGA